MGSLAHTLWGPTLAMAQLLSVLAVLSPLTVWSQVKHVKAGEEYSVVNRQDKSIVTNVFGPEVAEEKFTECEAPEDDTNSLYNFTTEDIEKLNNISFSDPEYTGKVLLVVNLASFWGYTPQYYSLNALTEKYADKPFKILGFPCNQFLRQEPGANASEIYSVLKHVRPGEGFVPNFEMFAKSDVNGKNENPIYTFLKGRCPSVRKEFQASYKLYYEPYHQDDIRWNFEKFLLDHRGQPMRRYDESLDPEDIIPDIDLLLNNLEWQWQ